MFSVHIKKMKKVCDTISLKNWAIETGLIAVIGTIANVPIKTEV